MTYLAGDTADGTLSFYATGLNDGMWLRIANIQVLDEDYSGMSQQNDGTWVYSENGNVDTQYTGMASNENGWWYFNNGAIDWNYTGMAANRLELYWNGSERKRLVVLSEWKDRLELHRRGDLPYRNGRIPYDLTSVVWTGLDWRYVRGGQIITDYTGMASNENGWWYFKNGAIDWNYTGMAENENGWWYYRNGTIDWNYTGEGICQSGTWYYQNGRISYNLTGVVWTGKQWRYIVKGKVMTDFTGTVLDGEDRLWSFINGQTV